MATQFAHSLLFVCPNCKSPIFIGCLSIKRNIEDIDDEHFAVSCATCKHSFNMPALAAKKHYVDEWPYQQNESQRCDCYRLAAFFASLCSTHRRQASAYSLGTRITPSPILLRSRSGYFRRAFSA